jgi:hypothetical protein
MVVAEVTIRARVSADLTALRAIEMLKRTRGRGRTEAQGDLTRAKADRKSGLWAHE